jgi:hypothetical protein
MGLEPRAFSEWLKPRAGDDAMLAERRALIATKSADVIAALPQGQGALVELAEVLAQQGFADLPRTGDASAMAAMGRTIAEDLCVLTPSGDQYALSAAALCFPNRWHLSDKIGRNLLAVHGPVPDYPAALAGTVDRFLARLRPMRPYVRENWGFASQPVRHLPDPIPPVDLARDGAFFLRTEEQSFLKLPATGAVIFAIRTTIVPWSDVPEDRKTALKAAVKKLSPAWLAYKSIVPG